MMLGERVYLRPIVKDDLPHLNQWRNDEDTFRFLGGGFMPISMDLQARWLDSLMDTTGSNKRYMICIRENYLPIGMIGLYDINWIHRVCEVGLYIGDDRARGKGFASEAYSLIERFARDYLNLRKIKLSVVSDNLPGVKMWQSLGYEKVGELNEERYIGGQYRNLIIMEKFIQ